MTISEFNKLKVGDSVYLPDNKQRTKYTSTEVLEIDRYYKKIKVLLRDRFISYKYYPKKVNFSLVSCIVGSCKDYNPLILKF